MGVHFLRDWKHTSRIEKKAIASIIKAKQIHFSQLKSEDKLLINGESYIINAL